MIKKVNARRYARAVFEIAQETNQFEKWQSDVTKIVSVLSDAALAAWLESPKIRFDEKVKQLTARLPGVSPLAMNLVRLLVAKGKPQLLGEIAGEYQRLLDSHRGIAHAEVTTAIPLGDEDKHSLAERLGAMVGKKVVIESSTDPAVIGGIVARIEGKLLDASTRTRLEALRKEMAGTGRR